MKQPCRRVLVIEDNNDGRESLRILLGLWGYDVATAADGERGVAAALSWKPDVALVDIGLPVLDGYAVARQVRARLGETIFLVALTAYSAPEDKRRAASSGFDAHVAKPADLQHLSNLLSGVN